MNAESLLWIRQGFLTGSPCRSRRPYAHPSMLHPCRSRCVSCRISGHFRGFQPSEFFGHSKEARNRGPYGRSRRSMLRVSLSMARDLLLWAATLEAYSWLTLLAIRCQVHQGVHGNEMCTATESPACSLVSMSAMTSLTTLGRLRSYLGNERRTPCRRLSLSHSFMRRLSGSQHHPNRCFALDRLTAIREDC